MNSETVINLCFIREKVGEFSADINKLLEDTFKEMDFTWQLSEKDLDEAELIIAQLNGKSNWTTEEEVVSFIDQQANEMFWDYLHGLQITNYPVVKGCGTCGSH